MSIGKIMSSGDIAISGLQAQSKRIGVIASNIANANTTRTQGGGPYRRKDLVLSTAGDGLSGVNIQGVVSDTQTPFQTLYSPGNPDANPEGYVQMPNVELPTEMMMMSSANRAYQANVAVLRRYAEIVDATLELLR